MKKFLISMLCVFSLVFSVGFVACGETEEDSGKNSNSSVIKDDGWTPNY